MRTQSPEGNAPSTHPRSLTAPRFRVAAGHAARRMHPAAGQEIEEETAVHAAPSPAAAADHTTLLSTSSQDKTIRRALSTLAFMISSSWLHLRWSCLALKLPPDPAQAGATNLSMMRREDFQAKPNKWSHDNDLPGIHEQSKRMQATSTTDTPTFSNL